MVKKLMTIFLCGIIVLAMVACGSNDASLSNPNEDVKQQEQQDANADNIVDDNIAVDKTQQSQTDTSKIESSKEINANRDDNVITAPDNFIEVVLCETELYTVKVDKIEYDQDYYVYFKLINKSKEQLRFEMYSPSVNDVMYENAAVSLTFYETIDAGGEGEANARFRIKDLEKWV